MKLTRLVFIVAMLIAPSICFAGGTTVGEGTIDYGTARVTIATDDDMVTSLGVVDDWDQTEDEAVGDDGALVMCEARSAQKTAVDAADASRFTCNLSGEQVVAGYDWTTGNVDVNLVSSQDGVSGDTGTIDAATLRVTVATDDTVATDLTAVKTAVEIMDDWDETDRAAVNPISGQAGITGGSGVIDAATSRVTIATDDTVATDLTATKTAVEIMDDWDESNRAAVNPISGQAGVSGGSGVIDASTQRVSIATDDTLVTNSTSIKTAVEIMDDWDATEDGAIGTDGAVVMMEARSTQKTAVDAADAVRPVTNLSGEQVVAGYDWSGGYISVNEANPVSSQYASTAHAEVTDGEDGTYNYEVTMGGYKRLTIQLQLDNGSGTATVKIYCKVHDSATYQDISTLYGAASWTGTDSPHTLFDTFDAGSCFKIKIEVVASTGDVDDADWSIYSKALY